MTAQTEDLIKRLEAAEAGSRGLDRDLGRALGLIDANRLYTSPDGDFVAGVSNDPWPKWTTSLDAALALAERVLPGWEVSLAQRKPRYDETCAEWWHASLFRMRSGVPVGGDGTVSIKAPTPALALCIAILRARSALTGSAQG